MEGDEDRATAGRRRPPLSAAQRATRDVIVDLAVLGQRLRAQGRTLWLAGAQPHIRRLIETVGLHRMPAVRLAGPAPVYSG